MPWPSKSPDLNPIKHYWDVIGRVFRRRRLTNVRWFVHVHHFLMDGWNGITQGMLNVWGMYVTLMGSCCKTVIEANDSHSRY